MSRAVGWRRCVEGTSGPTEVVKSWIDAFNNADVERLANLYHENAIDDEVANALVDGREAIRQLFATQFANTQMICIPENIFEEGQWAFPLRKTGHPDPVGCSIFFASRLRLEHGALAVHQRVAVARWRGLPARQQARGHTAVTRISSHANG